MATVGLRGILGLANLDQSGISTGKVAILLVGSSILAAGLLQLLLMNVADFRSHDTVNNQIFLYFFSV